MSFLDWIRPIPAPSATAELESLRRQVDSLAASRDIALSKWSRAMAAARRHQGEAAIAEARVCRLADQILKMGRTPCK